MIPGAALHNDPIILCVSLIRPIIYIVGAILAWHLAHGVERIWFPGTVLGCGLVLQSITSALNTFAVFDTAVSIPNWLHDVALLTATPATCMIVGGFVYICAVARDVRREREQVVEVLSDLSGDR